MFVIICIYLRLMIARPSESTSGDGEIAIDAVKIPTLSPLTIDLRLIRVLAAMRAR